MSGYKSDKEIIKGGIMLMALDIICNGGKVTCCALKALGSDKNDNKKRS